MNVFVSYSVKDQALADTIAADIGRAGLTYFLAPKSIRAGEPWVDRIRTALQSCSCLVVLLSPNSIQSEWVTTEWGAAWALGKHIIPVLFRCDSAAIPPRLASLQTCDYHQFGSIISQIVADGIWPAETALASSARPWVIIDSYSAEDLEDEFGEEYLSEKIRIVNRGQAPAVNITVPDLQFLGKQGACWWLYSKSWARR